MQHVLNPAGSGASTETSCKTVILKRSRSETRNYQGRERGWAGLGWAGLAGAGLDGRLGFRGLGFRVYGANLGRLRVSSLGFREASDACPQPSNKGAGSPACGPCIRRFWLQDLFATRTLHNDRLATCFCVSADGPSRHPLRPGRPPPQPRLAPPHPALIVTRRRFWRCRARTLENDPRIAATPSAPPVMLRWLQDAVFGFLAPCPLAARPPRSLP